MRNKLISFCLIAWIFAVLPLTAAAQEFDAAKKGSISVTLVSPTTDQPVAGTELSVYYVASVNIDTEGNLRYVTNDAFDDSGISLEDPELISQLDVFVTEHKVTSEKIVTDARGTAVCRNLPLGLYFVKQNGMAVGESFCAPFVVTLPFQTEQGLMYDVDASPKTDVVHLVSVTVKKIWNTDKSTATANSVTVQLLRHGELVKTATLNEQNNWQVTYDNLTESDGYSIKEVNVPKGFTATYTQKGYVFTVTNTSTLAQTGQIIWPIPVLATAGLFFLMMGLVILRKSERSNA